MSREAFVTGVGMTAAVSPRRQTLSELELCAEAVDGAVASAGVVRGGPDLVVVGNIDGFEGSAVRGRGLTAQLGIGADVPVVVVNTGGTTGGNLLQIAVRAVRSHSAENVLCLGGPTFASAVDLQAAINTNSPMIIEQPLGMGGFHMGAFAAGAYLLRYGLTSEDLADVAVADHRKASRNPYAHLRYEVTRGDVLASPMLSTPLTQAMVCPVSTSACAAIVSHSPATSASASARVAVMGTSGDPYLGGGKGDFSRIENLAVLADRIFRRAGIRDVRGHLDVVELFAPYVHMQPMQLEALGLAAPGQGVDVIRSPESDLGGSLPVNLSGGPKCTNAGVAGELAPFLHAAMQVMGLTPEPMRVDGARRALAHGTGGTFFQFDSLALFERAEKEQRA